MFLVFAIIPVHGQIVFLCGIEVVWKCFQIIVVNITFAAYIKSESFQEMLYQYVQKEIERGAADVQWAKEL